MKPLIISAILTFQTLLPAQETEIIVNEDPLPIEVSIEQEIKEVFGEDAEIMLEIAKYESELNPKALNPEQHLGCSGSRGLFQIACVNYNGNQEDLFEIKTNVAIAKQVYDRQGFRAWGVCTDGKVNCGL